MKLKGRLDGGHHLTAQIQTFTNFQSIKDMEKIFRA